MNGRDMTAAARRPSLLAGAMLAGLLAAPLASQAQVVKKPSKNFDATYNVCRGTSPECLAQNQGWDERPESTRDRVLIYSRTAGPRHANLGPVMEPGLNPPLTEAHVMQSTLVQWLTEEGFRVDWTETPSNFSPNNYAVVILASGNRDNLFDVTQTSPTTPMTNLRQYMRRGGGVVAIHNAFGANYNWPYYEGLLGNANFYNHGPNRTGTVQIIGNDPSTQGVTSSFTFQDEWYNLTPFPTNVKFLAKVDTDSLSPPTSSPHPGHPGFHPVAWCQYFDGGRVWATTLGHNSSSFNGSGVGAADFRKMIVQGVKSAAGAIPFCT